MEGGRGGAGGAEGGERGEDYCGVTGRPQVTFKIIRCALCCLPTVPTTMHDYNMHRRAANICTFFPKFLHMKFALQGRSAESKL